MAVKCLSEPSGQELNQLALILTFANRMGWPAKSKAEAVSFTIQNASVDPVFLDLPTSSSQRLPPRARQLVFPANENTFGEQVAHPRDHLRCWFEADCQRARTAGDFGRIATPTLFILHALDLVVAERGDMKDGGDIMFSAGLLK